MAATPEPIAQTIAQAIRTALPAGFDRARPGYTSGMEIGGFFLLVIIVVVLGALGGGVYAIAARLRQKQLDPRGDQVEGSPGAEGSQRPRHVEVASEQRTHFVDTH